jgi:hypothetical protein
MDQNEFSPSSRKCPLLAKVLNSASILSTSLISGVRLGAVEAGSEPVEDFTL